MPFTKEQMAQKAALEIPEGAIVNLGIGLPTLCADYLPEGHAWLHSENGLLGMGPFPYDGDEDPQLINAGNQPITLNPGGSYFDSATSFGMIRGGHVDATFLGTLQVDEAGNIANWIVPGKMLAGMGGAMDLVTGARQVIVAMQHTAKGKPKILEKCALPLTSVRPVDLVVTEMAVIGFPDGHATLLETGPGVSVEQVVAATEAKLVLPDDIPSMQV